MQEILRELRIDFSMVHVKDAMMAETKGAMKKIPRELRFGIMWISMVTSLAMATAMR